MSVSGSIGSCIESTGHNLLGGSLQVPNYHFKSTSTPSLAHGENVDIVCGYRISDRLPVIAKISGNSLRLEREYYVIKRLYQLTDKESYIVRPLDNIHLPTGLTMAIYADEGYDYLNILTRCPSDKSEKHGITALRDSRPLSFNSGPVFDLGTFLRFAIKCIECLEFIHKNNVVHGEIRISSFQWSGDDTTRVKLWNFGTGSKSFEAYLTSEGWRKTAQNKELVHSLKEILIFMSPEQMGRTNYSIDHRSDLYSLGMVFYVLLTGKIPFEGGPLKTLNAIVSKKLPLVNEIQMDIPEVIGRIVEKMTSKSPGDRYNSASGVKSDLKECLRRLKLTEETTKEVIENFNLGEKDVAVIFTLPKMVYGRQPLIVEMSYIIQHTVNSLQSQSKKEPSLSSGSAAPTITSASDLLHHYQNTESTITADTDAVSSELPSTFVGEKSTASPSFYSGSDRSNNAARLASLKQGVTIVCLSGPGGVGKSTLFNSVQPVARKEGYVASAKFDNRQMSPYSCILKSLSQIMQQILSESEEDIHRFYAHLKLHLGVQFCKIESLAELVPELKPLLDPLDDHTPEEVIHLDNVENRVRFHNLFVEVFRALSQWRMITLFLDDLHLADEPSSEVIESIISSRVDILIFLAYRDEEMTPSLNKLLNNDIAVFHHFQVQPLDMESITDYIVDTLHQPCDLESRRHVSALAEVVYRKTRGNVFYAGQLLTALEKKKLIYFNWEENKWDYSLTDVEQLVNNHNDYENQKELDIDFVINRLRELPTSGQQLLKWASFVGDTFSWSIVRQLISDSDTETETSTTLSGSSNRDTDSNRSESVHSGSLNHSLYQSRVSNRSSGMSSRDPMNGLQAALQEGYILPLESDEFKWSHDRYSQAAMALAGEESRESIHFKIAKFSVQDESVDRFSIADHLLKCMDLAYQSEDRSCYRDVFYYAGDKAKSSGAHKMALNYYKSAISLLDGQSWEPGHYFLTLSLYTNAVSLSWVVGDHGETEEYLNEIFKNANSPADRVTAYRIQHKYFFSRQMHKEGVEALYKCLKELDIQDFKFSCTREELDREFQDVRKMIQSTEIDTIVKTKTCKDSKLKSMMGILEELCTTAYWLGNQTEMFYLATIIVRTSLEHGMSPSSGVGLAYMGIAAVDFYKLFEFGEKLGMDGVMISERCGSNSEKGRTSFLYASFLLAWKSHQREQERWFRSAYRLSSSSGDRIYAAFSQVNMVTSMFFTGENLSNVLVEAETCYKDIYSWSSSTDSTILIMSVIRTIKALQGHTFNHSPQLIFNGDDGFNDENFVRESCKPSENPSLPMNWYDSFRMLALFMYGHYEYAISVGYMCTQTIHDHPGHRNTRMVLYLHSLAIVDKLRSEDSDKESRDMYIQRIKENQELLSTWVDHSSVNFKMWHTLVQAEVSSLGKNNSETMDLYEKAIDESREGGWFLELCICHELAGSFYARLGLKNIANGIIKKAIKLYISHGSYGKVNHLSNKFSELIGNLDDVRTDTQDAGVQTDPFPFLGPQNSWSTSSLGPNVVINEPVTSEVIPPVTTEQTLMTLDILDLESILKSSQVISSEVKFDLLLKAMMTIILENSGAECGAIMVKEDKYGIYAYGSQEEGSITFEPPRPISEKDSLICSRIVNHTINTNESLFIHNIDQDTRFALGPWYENTRNKSVICMPIVYKATMVGCLFIEGPAGIFTQRHITVLSLLCQQMGISISNAFLFKSVQRVTMANMRMIEMQKKALEDSRKSKEAAVRATRLREIFLANMSHEIRTPFSGFYGMISLLADTQLDNEQMDLVKTAKESCEILLQIIDDLLNFSKLQAGKVSLDISPIVVEDIMADVVEMLIAMAIQRGINVTYAVSDDVPSIVLLDGNRLRQILINLLGNAIKFTHDGEVCINCSLDKSRKESDSQVSLLFEVTDTGIGISNEQRKVLFEPFSQVDGSTTRKYGGTGLGLSICLQLVELMGGAIDVKSVPNEGSNFYFSIRVSHPKSDTQSLNQDIQEQTNLLGVMTSYKVLVISSYKATVEMVRRFLPGIYVDGVDQVEKVEQLIKKVKYDVIIVGLTMSLDDQNIHLSWLVNINQSIKDTLVVVMNYPAGRVTLKNKWIVDPTPSQPLACKLVRMAVPIRRMKLLKTINEAINPPATSNNITKPKKAPNSLVTDEEREMYSQMHILIAEDNPVAQKLLLKQLTRLGFNVECANNGLEAIEIWTSRPNGHFAMAFFDHHMPKCDGVAATKSIRETENAEDRPIRLSIVALTADVQESAQQTCIGAGMDGYLTKPLNQKVLVESLRQYCLSDTFFA
ncbi:hypothetical protein BY458DRAFT_557511 [Sporodiniella umbellata]|nr:hypothetical protein BY458DRAFT_557511 [Sporodiniella umbellata]